MLKIDLDVDKATEFKKLSDYSGYLLPHINNILTLARNGKTIKEIAGIIEPSVHAQHWSSTYMDRKWRVNAIASSIRYFIPKSLINISTTTDDEKSEIVMLKNSGVQYPEIARRFNLSRQTIHNICRKYHKKLKVRAKSNSIISHVKHELALNEMTPAAAASVVHQTPSLKFTEDEIWTPKRQYDELQSERD
jgi:DNA-binding CsgD family transcriptional regulator